MSIVFNKVPLKRKQQLLNENFPPIANAELNLRELENKDKILEDVLLNDKINVRGDITLNNKDEDNENESIADDQPNVIEANHIDSAETFVVHDVGLTSTSAGARRRGRPVKKKEFTLTSFPAPPPPPPQSNLSPPPEQPALKFFSSNEMADNMRTDSSNNLDFASMFGKRNSSREDFNKIIEMSREDDGADDDDTEYNDTNYDRERNMNAVENNNDTESKYDKPQYLGGNRHFVGGKESEDDEDEDDDADGKDEKSKSSGRLHDDTDAMANITKREIKFELKKLEFFNYKVPPIHDSTPLEELKCILNDLRREIQFKSIVSEMEMLFVTICNLIEFGGTRFLGLNLTGFAKHEITYNKSKYDNVFMEMSKRSLFSWSDNLPPEFKFIFMMATGVGVYVIKNPNKKMGSGGRVMKEPSAHLFQEDD